MWTLAVAMSILSRTAADCDKVVFEGVDAKLKLRTMVVEDASRSRMLVLTPSDDTTEPCTLRWWLDHNPQGAVQCRGSQSDVSCDPTQCNPDASQVELGYVRSMLASALFTPRRTVRPSPTLQASTSSWLPRLRAKRMLVIGLGSSTMALWLRHALPEVQLDVAELVPGVIAAAPCFGLNPRDTKLTLHAGDGRDFLERKADGSYDAILVDAFDSNASLPLCFRSRQFFSMAKRKLVAGGALSFNLLANKESRRILQSMAASFGSKQIWLGDAPGAEGVQNVITAFSGQASILSRSDEKLTVPEDAVSWFQRARYRLLSDVADLHSAKEIEDGVQCRYNN